MIIAETSRLLISKFTTEDAPFFMELVNTPNWLKYIGERNVKTILDAEVYLTNGPMRHYEVLGFGFYKVELKSENLKPIGTCGLVKRDELDDIDIGFAMLPNYEGKGFGFEATSKIMDYAKHLLQLKRIVAITLPSNKNSIKLLEKLGLNYEKTVIPFEDKEELLLFAKTF